MIFRSLDLTLDALEADPSNQGLLRLVGNFNEESVPHVVGFKLGHYRNPFVAKVHRARAREALNKQVGMASDVKRIDLLYIHAIWGYCWQSSNFMVRAYIVLYVMVVVVVLVGFTKDLRTIRNSYSRTKI